MRKPARAQIIPSRRTEIRGDNGLFPEPTIVSRSGRRPQMTHRNELPVPFAAHLHGDKMPQRASNGYPTDLVLPSGALQGHEGDKHSAGLAIATAAVVTTAQALRGGRYGY
ncbi:multicopper oxidase domain-containing protein [Nonomuraea jabiensis]|uniref:FtsP/CotA-like multicopper oxidase with cupredoxin domain n=1 Tax=Nonomuraea jabiensis TaxID=882448 RepID=A0A7W9GDK5_9ACTN|nr:multicopper oxidase domain-containing protein [Nonomuraea jabiensis]MBB5781849.1 FtsP/CotA-like multicopper oxidase with cupredoxin domain [Nonomuraea jabiensis]